MTVTFITVTLIELFNVSNSILSTVHIRMSDIECDFSLTHRACNYAAIQLFPLSVTIVAINFAKTLCEI